MKIRKLAISIVLCCLSLSTQSYCQATPPGSAPMPRPELTPQQKFEMRWSFFFANLKMDEEVSKDNAKHGRQDFADMWHRKIQTDLGLTDEQFALVWQIANEYLEGNEERGKKVAAAAHEWRAQYPGIKYVRTPEIQALEDERHKFCEDEVGKLVIGLGSNSFATLDAYVSHEVPGTPQGTPQ